MLVILADRDPSDLEALRCCLEASTCDVVTASDGPEVVSLALERSPEAVIVSSSLGRMGGFAVSRQLKTAADAGEINDPTVIVLIDRASDAWLAGWARTDAWVTKPVDPVEVASLLDSLLAGNVA